MQFTVHIWKGLIFSNTKPKPTFNANLKIHFRTIRLGQSAIMQCSL